MKAYDKGHHAVEAVGLAHPEVRAFAAGLHGDWSAGSIGSRRTCRRADADCGGGFR